MTLCAHIQRLALVSRCSSPHPPKEDPIAVPVVEYRELTQGGPQTFQPPPTLIHLVDTFKQCNFFYSLSDADLQFYRSLSDDDKADMPLLVFHTILDRLEWLFPFAAPPSEPPTSYLPLDEEIQELQMFLSDPNADRYRDLPGYLLTREHRPPPIAPVMQALPSDLFVSVVKHWRKERLTVADHGKPYFMQREPGAPLVSYYRKPPLTRNDMQPFCPGYELGRRRTLKSRKVNSQLIANMVSLRAIALQVAIREQIQMALFQEEDETFCRRMNLPVPTFDAGTLYQFTDADLGKSCMKTEASPALPEFQPQAPRTRLPSYIPICYSSGDAKLPHEFEGYSFLRKTRFGHLFLTDCPCAT